MIFRCFPFGLPVLSRWAKIMSTSADAYSEIDPAVRVWLPRHGLFLQTHHRDESIRVIPIVDDQGDQYQIAVGPPGAEKELNISGGLMKWSDRRTFHRHRVEQAFVIRSSVDALPSDLEDAYDRITQWIKERNHTRTPA